MNIYFKSTNEKALHLLQAFIEAANILLKIMLSMTFL